jgi:hypothetical protein
MFKSTVEIITRRTGVLSFLLRRLLQTYTTKTQSRQKHPNCCYHRHVNRISALPHHFAPSRGSELVCERPALLGGGSVAIAPLLSLVMPHPRNLIDQEEQCSELPRASLQTSAESIEPRAERGHSLMAISALNVQTRSDGARLKLASNFPSSARAWPVLHASTNVIFVFFFSSHSRVYSKTHSARKSHFWSF